MKNYDSLMAYLAKETAEEHAPLWELHREPPPPPAPEPEPAERAEYDDTVDHTLPF
jgi:hypothetical protein